MIVLYYHLIVFVPEPLRSWIGAAVGLLSLLIDQFFVPEEAEEEVNGTS